MHTLLIVSNNPEHLTAMQVALREDGYIVRAEPTLEQGLVVARKLQPELFCLDIGIGLTAGELSALLRDPQVENNMQVLAIATREQFYLVGAGSGIADVVTPPLDPAEIQLRVSRLLSTPGAESEQLLLHGELLIDQERYTVRLGDDVVDLTYKEYELLRFLAQNPGKAFTRDMLLNQVWGYDYYGGARTVDVHVRRIRAKIERREPYIETVRNVGYRFVEEPRLR